MSADAALTAARQVAALRYAIGYAKPDGLERTVSLPDALAVAFEAVPPVRSFARYQGQRSNTGLWWSASTGGHVGFESWLERDHLMLLDFDPMVAAIASQPFRLYYDDGTRVRRHVPDFFARLTDGTGVVIDVRPAARVKPADAAGFAATGRACALVGWQYRLLHEPDATVTANVRWLAGYRHPRCARPDLQEAAEELLAAPMPLMQAGALLGDPLASLPVIFHLLWRGRLRTDLTIALSATSPVTAVRR
ncbi:hypothetical protein BG844_04795 [Couchioplanes caeruleus subsp. caeruleus]|uniref:TnsA endonuclease N-terminal domain-containing protein n=2 Tax=Couchioplanes caeruleus TaxID=56438 RepID=A0A1K0FRG1_9ACTN|nr:hypothetical protein BG844_04795 [Couchioplanes caeruleus subsp. caeruleus]